MEIVKGSGDESKNTPAQPAAQPEAAAQPAPISAQAVKDAPWVECEKCQSQVFTQERIKIKQISKFLTGASQDSIIPMPVIACAECGHVNKLFEPKI